MKEQTNKIHENLREGKEAYEAPQCEIIEIQNEGVLCLSDNQNPSPGVGRSTDSYGW